MIYYLTQALMPHISALDVFRYNTVRAGGAALTAFLFCLLAGPRLIALLRMLKAGQYIKKDHVADLHALHKGKAGTPTMGGAIMLLSTLLSLLLWSTLTNRLLWVALAVLLMLGAVGFLDDYIKLRRKHNDGLSARAKFAGQIMTGLLLGGYLFLYPITVNASYVRTQDVLDFPKLAKAVAGASNAGDVKPLGRVWNALSPEGRETFSRAAKELFIDGDDRTALLTALNETLTSRDVYAPGVWPLHGLNGEAQTLMAHGTDGIPESKVVRVNRLLLEAVLPQALARSVRNLHTKVGVPGLKDVLIPLGPLYILFVIILIVSISNAVNLTDGLDGLAVGTSIISILAYTAIAYVVSRADWSRYLYLTYVPEASELFVFGATLLGAGLGFLWFNAHPAEVFMGDTGSLALGGAIGTMAVLTKQELLLPIVAGLFVIEALSVVIQVGSFKLTGKRVFRMAPLHHHFELKGWPETKVTMRFWIIALLFALLSLATLKLR